MIRLQLCATVHTYAPLPHRTHTLCALHTQILYTHSCSLSLAFLPFFLFFFYLFLMLTCTQLHTHARTFPPMHANSLKGSLFTHSYNTSLSPPFLLFLLLLLLFSLPATLPLGSVSWNGLKELAPCTWSALFTRTCMWAGRIVESSLSACTVHLGIGRVRAAFCLSAHTCIKFGLIYFKPNFFSSLASTFAVGFFFFSDQPIHPHRLGHLHSAYFLPEGGVFLVYTLGVKRLFSWFGLWMKWRGARHRILEDNLATPPKDTHTHSQPLLLILCGSRHHMLRLPSWLLVTSLFMDAFPDGLGEKIWVPTREQRVQGFATPLLSAGLQLQNRTELSSAGKSASQKIQGSVQ